MSENAIELDSVTKKFQKYSLLSAGFKNYLLNMPRRLIWGGESNAVTFGLEDISFSVERGDTLGVIGPNGAGKSTLLGLIAGVLEPDLGTVDVNGNISPLLELGAGFHPELNGRENILLNGILLGMTRPEMEERLEKIIEFSELGEYIDQPIRSYSSGMQMRLGFSVAIHVDLEILLIDEVFAVGDQSFQEKCFSVMEDFQESGEITMIFVSHNLAQVNEICDRVLHLQDGTIAGLGEAEKVIDDYAGEEART